MRPADVLAPNWSLSHPAAFDLKVNNPLNSDSILEASMIPGSTAEKGERDKPAADAGFRRGGGTLVGGTPNTHS